MTRTNFKGAISGVRIAAGSFCLRPGLLRQERETTNADHVRDALSSERGIAWNRERSARNNTGSGQTFRRREHRPCLVHGVQGVRCRCTFCLSIGSDENIESCCRLTVTANAQVRAGVCVVMVRQILRRIRAAGAELDSHMQPHPTGLSVPNMDGGRANLGVPRSLSRAQLPVELQRLAPG